MGQGDEPGSFLIDLILSTSLDKCIRLVVSPPAGVRGAYCSGMRNLIHIHRMKSEVDITTL